MNETVKYKEFSLGGHFMVLTIDGVKKLVSGGTASKYLVTENNKVVTADKIGQSKRFDRDYTAYRIIIDGKHDIINKKCMLKIIANSIDFGNNDFADFTIVPSCYISFTKYDEKGYRTAKIKKSSEANFMKFVENLNPN
jgi:hypothetical protein